MPKRSNLDIFGKSLKNRPPQRSVSNTLGEGQGVSMPEKQGLEPIEGKEADGPTPRCLGFDCEYVSYKDIEGKTVLWCSKVNEKVYVMQDCPFENWFKDDKGRIIKRGRNHDPRNN